MADTLHTFASFREAQNHLHEAVLLFQRALTIREQSLGANHWKTVEARRYYLKLLRAVGREEEAMHIEILSAE